MKHCEYKIGELPFDVTWKWDKYGDPEIVRVELNGQDLTIAMDAHFDDMCSHIEENWERWEMAADVERRIDDRKIRDY